MAPWTQLWDRNYFGDLWPWLDGVMENAYTRGAVTGVGLITAFAGLRDLVSAIVGRWSGHDRHADQ